MSWKVTVAVAPDSQIIGSPVRNWTFFPAGDQSAQLDDFRARVLIEAHDRGVGSVEITQYSDAAVQADVNFVIFVRGE